jgi:hypothetical protein
MYPSVPSFPQPQRGGSTTETFNRLTGIHRARPEDPMGVPKVPAGRAVRPCGRPFDAATLSV